LIQEGSLARNIDLKSATSGFDSCVDAARCGDRLTVDLIPALKTPEGQPRQTEYGNWGRQTYVRSLPPSAPAKDFLCNRMFAWAELSFGESTFKLLITPIVHLLLSYVAGGAGRRRLLERLHDRTHCELVRTPGFCSRFHRWRRDSKIKEPERRLIGLFSSPYPRFFRKFPRNSTVSWNHAYQASLTFEN
jgi:hypothetical protein